MPTSTHARPIDNAGQGLHRGSYIPTSPKQKLQDLIDHLKKKGNVYPADVLVVGSGPIGAVFARKLVDGGKKVLMVDMGESASKRFDEHLQNSVAFQKDVNTFTNMIRGGLSPLSVTAAASSTQLPPEFEVTKELNSEITQKRNFVLNGQNAEQNQDHSLASSAVTRTVGDRWTCCTPRQSPDVFSGENNSDIGFHERSDLFTDKEWEDLYTKAEHLFETNSTTFDNSVRQRLVTKILKDAFQTSDPKREVKPMPLACKLGGRKNRIDWSCTASILGKNLSHASVTDKACYEEQKFSIFEQTQLKHMLIEKNANGTTVVTSAIIQDLENQNLYVVEAKRYVVCGGAVLTAGILANSLYESQLEGDDGEDYITTEHFPSLGKYLTEQSMAFCQVVLKKEHVERVRDDPGHLDQGGNHIIKEAVETHKREHRDDNLPFPFDDLDLNVYTPFTEKYPWHAQIHRDAFGQGEVPAGIDQRLIVDLRFFGYTLPNKNNRVAFSYLREDHFGMPQPTFHIAPGKSDVDRSNRMMNDMINVANSLGVYLPGAEPQYSTPDLALHVCGIYRAGKPVFLESQKDTIDLEATKADSVVDRNGQVWGVPNLYLGGCGVIPTGTACNPTLTAACHAISGAEAILKELGNEA